jgi:hypothetical protein
VSRYSLDLVKFLKQQRNFSLHAFGPNERTKGIVDHIKKEIKEIEKAETPGEKMNEFVDVVILALDAMWRLGFSPEEIVVAIQLKQSLNIRRKWPDWRTVPENEAVEHDRSQADTADPRMRLTLHDVKDILK